MISVYKLKRHIKRRRPKSDILLIGTCGDEQKKLISFGIKRGIDRYDGYVYNGWNMGVFEKTYGKITIKGSKYISLKTYQMVVHLINPLIHFNYGQDKCYKDPGSGDIINDYKNDHKDYQNEKCIGIISENKNQLNIITESNKIYTYVFNDVVSCIKSKGFNIRENLTINKKKV